MEEEQRKREEREKGETGRGELVQRAEILRELLWIAVKENKALATSDALQVAPKERQVRLQKEPYACPRSPTYAKRALSMSKEPYSCPKSPANTRREVILTRQETEVPGANDACLASCEPG